MTTQEQATVDTLAKALSAAEAERDALKVTLEGIALNAPQTEPQLWACNANYAIADSYFTAGKLASAALKAAAQPEAMRA